MGPSRHWRRLLVSRVPNPVPTPFGKSIVKRYHARVMLCCSGLCSRTVRPCGCWRSPEARVMHKRGCTHAHREARVPRLCGRALALARLGSTTASLPWPCPHPPTPLVSASTAAGREMVCPIRTLGMYICLFGDCFYLGCCRFAKKGFGVCG